jgi:hypothetical protein
MAAPAHADEACVQAYERGQVLRQQKKLTAASEQFRVCAAPSCPAAARKDCVTWLSEVEAALPSVIVAPRDPSGAALSGVRKLVDGAAVGDGAIPLDPGPHQIRCERAGTPAASYDVTLREGEKNKVITCTLAPAAKGSGPKDLGPRGDKKLLIGGAIAGAAGLVLVGVGTAFVVSGVADRRSLLETCYPYCPSASVSSVHTKLVTGDATIGVGLAAVGTAATLFILHRFVSGPAVAATPLPGGATFSVASSW